MYRAMTVQNILQPSTSELALNHTKATLASACSGHDALKQFLASTLFQLRTTTIG